MGKDRVTEIRVEGLRALGRISLRLSGLTVLIGENGTGKSSVIEACEILRRATAPRFLDELGTIHGFPSSMLRVGATRLVLGVRVQNDSDDPLDYEFGIAFDGRHVVIGHEFLLYGPQAGHPYPLTVIERSRSAARLFDQGQQKLVDFQPSNDRLMLSSFGTRSPNRQIERMMDVLEQFQVHLPFDVQALWASRALGRPTPLRVSTTHIPADRLSRLGLNLANTFSALKNDFGEAHWQETMQCVRLGLGADVESVNTRADPGGGSIGLWLKYKAFDEQFPAAVLSDGTLAYLAFVALYRLSAKDTLLAFDTPEAHLHPRLLLRVLDFMEAMAQERTVLLATQSDALLDGLSEPASSVVLCELDEGRATRLVRPDPRALDLWQERYRGLGDVRAAGHESSVMTDPG